MGDSGSSSGQHKIIDLPDIFQSLANKRWTGTLQVVGKGRNTYFFFKEGNVLHAKADLAKVALGRALFKLGKLEESDLNLALQDGGGKRIGEACLELGLVTPQDIKEALVFQARESAIDVFGWEDIDARFHPGEPPLADVFRADDLEVKLGMSPMGLLMEAARRSDEWDIVKGSIPSLEDILVLPDDMTASAEQRDIKPELRRLMGLVDGYRTVGEIADAAPTANFEAIKQLAEWVKEDRVRRLEPVEIAKLALELERDQQIEKALKLYELAESRGVDRVDLAKRIARAYQLLGKNAESLERWFKLAKRTEESGRPDQAIEALGAALAIDPLRIDIHERLAKLFMSSGRGEEAAAQLRNLIVELDKLPEKEVDLDKLIWAHRELLEVAPEDEAALRRCTELHVKARDKVQALVRCDELAQLLMARGAFQEAVAVFRRELEIDEECLEGRLGLAQALAKSGSVPDAVKEYRKLADILFRSGLIGSSVNWGFLIKVYESIVELEPQSTEAWEWLGKCYLENGQSDLAISRYLGMAQSLEVPAGETPKPEIIMPLKKVVDLDPDRFDIRQRLAQAHLALGQIERGVATYHGLALAAFEKNDLPLAIDSLDEGLHADPFHLDSRKLLAQIHEQKGDTTSAQQLWRETGGLCLRARLFDQASEALRRAVELKPDDLVSLEELSAAEEKRGRLREAAQGYARLSEAHKQRENAGLAREHMEHAQKIVATARAQTQRVRAAGSSGAYPTMRPGDARGSSGRIPVPPQLGDDTPLRP
jgi:tetratricopeptide (TPR) repeat protein